MECSNDWRLGAAVKPGVTGDAGKVELANDDGSEDEEDKNDCWQVIDCHGQPMKDHRSDGHHDAPLRTHCRK